MDSRPCELSIFNQVFSCHVRRLFHTHDVQNRRSHICQYAIFHFRMLVGCYVYKRNGVQRMSRVWRSVSIQSMVGIAMICNDDDLLVVGLGCFNSVPNTIINSYTSLFNRFIHTCMSHHVSIRIVHYDKIVFFCIDGCH